MEKTISLVVAALLGAMTVVVLSPASAEATPRALASMGTAVGNPPDSFQIRLDMEALAASDGMIISIETTAPFVPGPTEAASGTPAASSETRRTVIVDGIVMSLWEAVIEAKIADGTFILVYVGTTEEVLPLELECWLSPNPDCF